MHLARATTAVRAVMVGTAETLAEATAAEMGAEAAAEVAATVEALGYLPARGDSEMAG